MKAIKSKIRVSLVSAAMACSGMGILPSYAETAPATKPASAAPVKRLYTEEEFQKAVLLEVEQALVRTKQEKFVDLTKEILKKENELKTKEIQLSKEKEQLEINKKEFEKKIKSIQEDQAKVLGCLDDQDKQKEKRVDHMVEVVSNMKPDSAAKLLSVQEVDLAVSILGKLDPQKVSKIFNLMDKEISARLQKQYMVMKK